MRSIMNKADFVSHIAELHECTKVEAEKVIDMFTSSLIDAARKGNDISLVGFGQFAVSQIAARTGRNPKTQQPMEIAAYRHVRFKAGQKLRDAVNEKI